MIFHFIKTISKNLGKLISSDDEENILDRINRKYDSKGRPIIHRNTTMNLEKTLKRQKSKRELEIVYDDTGQGEMDSG